MCISNTPSIFSLMDLDFRGHRHSNSRYRGREVIGQEMQLPLFTPGILEHLTSAWTFHFPTQMIDYLKRTQGWTKMMHTRFMGIVDYQHIYCGCINNLIEHSNTILFVRKGGSKKRALSASKFWWMDRFCHPWNLKLVVQRSQCSFASWTTKEMTFG